MPLPPVLTLLVALGYLATGGIHILIGDSLNVSRATARQCIRREEVLLKRVADRFIIFPHVYEANKTKQEFFQIAGKDFSLEFLCKPIDRVLFLNRS